MEKHPGDEVACPSQKENNSRNGVVCIVAKCSPSCCDLWCLTRTIFLVFIIHSMHSLKDTQFLLCYFLFIVPMLKNDLKLCVNHQFIAPSLYNQITQLIFITDIFRPKIKCTTLFGGLLCLCEVSRFLSKLLTDHTKAAK